MHDVVKLEASHLALEPAIVMNDYLTAVKVSNESLGVIVFVVIVS